MLSPPDLQRFRRDGFVALPGVIPEAFLRPALDALREWHASLNPADERLWFRDQAMDSYTAAFWAELTRVVDPLANCLAGSGRSRLLAPQLIGSPGSRTSDPRAGGWHLDTVEVARRDGFAGNPPAFPQFDLIVGVYLTDMTADGSGHLLAWPGSHRTITAHVAGKDDLNQSLPTLYADLHDAIGEPVPILGPPGTLILMNSFLAHATSVNQSEGFSGRAYLRYAHETIDRTAAWRTGDAWYGWATA